MLPPREDTSFCDRNRTQSGILDVSASGLVRVLPTHTAPLFEAAVSEAAEQLRAGEVVAVPTETVYGLAANALNESAVRKIFEIKGRPAHNPVIVHVCDTSMARQCTGAWPVEAEKLARAFWPGPLTIVLQRTEAIPGVVTAGGDTVGVRWPSHPFIQAVIRRCGFPLAAPSANLSNQISPTNATHVLQQLGDKLRLIIDGGQSQVGIESTVIHLTGEGARILRPGMIHLESIQAVLGEDRVCVEVHENRGPLRSPGLLDKHYSPKARLIQMSWRDDEDLKNQLTASGLAGTGSHVIAHSRIPAASGFGGVSVIPHDAEAFARALYSELHRCDTEGAECIIVESLPDAPEWRAIADRLRRAAG